MRSRRKRAAGGAARCKPRQTAAPAAAQAAVAAALEALSHATPGTGVARRKATARELSAACGSRAPAAPVCACSSPRVQPTCLLPAATSVPPLPLPPPPPPPPPHAAFRAQLAPMSASAWHPGSVSMLAVWLGCSRILLRMPSQPSPAMQPDAPRWRCPTSACRRAALSGAVNPQHRLAAGCAGKGGGGRVVCGWIPHSGERCRREQGGGGGGQGEWMRDRW